MAIDSVRGRFEGEARDPLRVGEVIMLDVGSVRSLFGSERTERGESGSESMIVAGSSVSVVVISVLVGSTFSGIIGGGVERVVMMLERLWRTTSLSLDVDVALYQRVILWRFQPQTMIVGNLKTKDRRIVRFL